MIISVITDQQSFPSHAGAFFFPYVSIAEGDTLYWRTMRGREGATAAAAVILGDVFVQCLRWPAAWLHQLLATASCRSLG